MAYVVALIVGLAFGAGDQYLGARSLLGTWSAGVSMVSAPWLLLSFAAGATQHVRRRAILLGLVIIVPALIGYFAMTCSTFESVPSGRFSTCFVTVARAPYNPVWILGGLLLGPVFGYLGQRWRVDRSWVSAVAVSGVLCLEPVARLAVRPWLNAGQPVAWWSEAAVGVLVAIFFAWALIGSHRGRRDVTYPGDL